MPTSAAGPIIPSAMQEALDWLRAHQLRHRPLTAYQVKIGPVSYFPGKGTIFIDQEPRRRPDTGLDALADVLRELALLPPA